MDTLRIGKIINNPQHRDAVHMAIAPMEAGQLLQAGQHVGVKDGKAVLNTKKPVGIVDPFLREPVPTGKMFWLFLYPGSITSLRHEWTHPDFFPDNPSTPDKTPSEKWLRRFAATHRVAYETILETAFNVVERQDSYLPGVSGGVDVPDEFWDHYEVILGRPIPERNRTDYFSCAC